MRVVRVVLGSVIASGFVLVGASVASAQTTTTVPPVRTIPVTGGQTATTTTAPTTGSTETTEAGGLADTGTAADMIVPFGFALIGAGAVMQAAARRPRSDYGLL